MSRWICKACTRWGMGGPQGWERHWKAEHQHSGRYASALSFGFVPNLSDGRRTSHWSDWRPAPRCDDRTEP